MLQFYFYLQRFEYGIILVREKLEPNLFELVMILANWPLVTSLKAALDVDAAHSITN